MRTCGRSAWHFFEDSGICLDTIFYKEPRVLGEAGVLIFLPK